MSGDDGKRPAKKGPRLPRLPKKGPKTPKGPKAPGQNPFANRFAATVEASAMPAPASSAPSSSQHVSVSVSADAIDVSSLAMEESAPQAPLTVSVPARPAPGTAGSPAPEVTWTTSTPSREESSLSADEVDAFHGDGADDFAALFAEVMDEDDAHVDVVTNAMSSGSASSGSGRRIRAPEDDSLDDLDVEWSDEVLPGDDDDYDDANDPDVLIALALAAGMKFDDDVPPSDLKVTEEQSRNYMAVFAHEIRHMTIDERIAGAHHADAERLHAFCYDSANARVIKAVLENGHAGFSHARLIMAHHHTSAGLLLVGSRSSFLRDAGVQRALFKNPQAPQGLLQRIVQHKPLQQVYKLAISREQTAKVKTSMRMLFRKKFQQSGPEECAALILKTEARCLGLLAGIPLSAKTCAILCGRPIHSTIMIQNLARFPATLPRLLEHMFRQPTVKRNAGLRNLILRHPNAPSQLKRGQK